LKNKLESAQSSVKKALENAEKVVNSNKNLNKGKITDVFTYIRAAVDTCERELNEGIDNIDDNNKAQLEKYQQNVTDRTLKLEQYRKELENILVNNNYEMLLQSRENIIENIDQVEKSLEKLESSVEIKFTIENIDNLQTAVNDALKTVKIVQKQAINTTDQSQYYNNPAATHVQTANFYMQNNGMDPQYDLPVRNPGQYQTRMNPPSYNYSQMPNGFQQPFFLPQAYSQNQFMPSTNPRPMIPIIRSANETMNNHPHFILQNGYPPPQYTPGNNSLSSVHSRQFYQTYQIPAGYAPQQVQTQMINQPQISQQQQQAYITSLQTATKVHPTQPTQHAPIDQPSASVPTSQPQKPLNALQSSSYVAPPAVAVATVLREKKKCPSVIINPDLHNPIALSPQSILASAINVSNKVQMQTEFQKPIAQDLVVSSNVIIDKPADPVTKVCDQSSVNQSESQSILPLPATTSVDNITPQQTLTINNNEKSASPTQRLHYDCHELLRIRDILGPFPIPKNLPDLDIFITRRDDNDAKSSHAVDDSTFSLLYAKLCKQFQKTQVTVQGRDGKLITYYFRQILLTRCQKEFESDYREEIEYEKRKAEIDSLTDNTKRKEEAEKLEKDLLKGKRRKLGNIVFLGELFKLQMLTDTIMHDCIEYLLSDKSNEESIECLCCLLRTIGKELDDKALEKASWAARRADAKPTTIDETHEQEQHHDQSLATIVDTAYSGGNQKQYNDENASHANRIDQQFNSNEDGRVENNFNVNSIRQLQSNDKRNQGPFTMKLAPQRSWSKGSGIEKKPETDHSFAGRTVKPLKSLMQCQSSRTLARENALQSLRKATTGSEVNTLANVAGTTSIRNYREDSRNISHEQSRNESDAQLSNTSSSVRVDKTYNHSTTIINQDLSNTTFDEEKTIARVHALIEKYTENYSNLTDRPVKEALEDLVAFSTRSFDQQAIIVREVFTNVLDAKPRARRVVGDLLDAAHNENIISEKAFLAGVKMIIEAAPDYTVDIPLIWQYIGEIIGAFIGARASNMTLLKPIFECVPDDKAKLFFQVIIRYATKFSSQSYIQSFWQSSDFSLNDLIKANLIDSTFSNEFDWLFDTPEIEQSTSQTKESHSPHPDMQLVKLFKSVNDQGTIVTDSEIITYIREHMGPSEKFYIRNIVLSYLEACLINRDPQKKIQEDIAKKRMTVLNAIIEHKLEAEIQAVYAIQNFVNKLEHPPKMAQLLFDMFYDEECVSESAFFEWRQNPDQSETEGHVVVEISTIDFFTWLQHTESELGAGEEEWEN
ncbi:unnamed protein product, partial [Rotaria magnacalcarata]